MNWGTKIVISLGTFIAFIVSLGVFMMISNDEKVEKDYYERDLMYEKEIQAQRNAQNLSAEVVLDITKDNLAFVFPKEIKDYTGKISFMRPDDANKDQAFEMKLEKDQTQVINAEKLQKGLWKIQVQWQMEGKSYQSKVFEWIKY